MEASLQSQELKPILIKDILLLSPGRWNDCDYTELEIQKAFNSTDWNDRKFRTLYLDHQDTKERGVANFAGFVQNQRMVGSKLYGDLEVWNPMIGAYLAQAKAKFGISATLAGRENKALGRMEDFHFESFSIVTDPACKPAMINLADKSVNLVTNSDVHVVTMENEIPENLTELESVKHRERREDGIKDNLDNPKAELSDSEFAKERKEHPSFTDEQIRQIVKDHSKELAEGTTTSGTCGGSEVTGAYGTEPAVWDKKKKKKDELSSELNPSLVAAVVLTEKSESDATSRKENSDLNTQMKGGIKMPEIIENTSVKVAELETKVEAKAEAVELKKEPESKPEDKKADKKADEDKDEDKEEMSSDAILNKVKEMSADELVKFTEFTKAHLSANKEASAKEVYLAFEKSKKDKKSEKELSANDLLASIDSRIASLKELDSSKKMQEMETKIQELSAKVKTPDRKTLSVAFSNVTDATSGMLSFLQHRIN